MPAHADVRTAIEWATACISRLLSPYLGDGPCGYGSERYEYGQTTPVACPSLANFWTLAVIHWTTAVVGEIGVARGGGEGR